MVSEGTVKTVERYSSRKNIYRKVNGKGSSILEKMGLLDSQGVEDPFNYTTRHGNNEVISPPVNPAAMFKLVYDCSYLVQCISAMVTNVYGFGWRVEFNSTQEDLKETDPVAAAEKRALEELFLQPNGHQTWSQMLELIGWDRYASGNAYIEVVRDSKNRVVALHHLPALRTRICAVDKLPTEYIATIARFGKTLRVKSKMHFRRYAQINDTAGGSYTYFKQFGDPRTIDPKTGKENTSLSLENSATEVIHIRKYNGMSPYGYPEWWSQKPSVIGSRQSEYTNQDFFENNAVPAMAVLASGGHLTEESYDAIVNSFDSVKGRGSTNKVIVLEARGAMEDAGVDGKAINPSLGIRQLTNERQSDAFFRGYETDCRDKIRSAYRLPGVFLGSIEATTYAAVKTALEITESQVFIPERNSFDDFINNKLLQEWELKHVRYRTAPSALVTSDDVLTAITNFNNAGAMTPNVAIGILNEKLNLDMPKIKEFWGNMPLKLVESVLSAQGGPDKYAYVVNALKTLTEEDVTTVPVPDVPAPDKSSSAFSFEKDVTSYE